MTVTMALLYCYNVVYYMLPLPLFLVAQQPYSGLGRLVAEVSRLHTDTPHPAGLLWTKDRPVVETST